MIKPPKLNIGDSIAFVAPSSVVPQERLEPAIKAMQKLGLNVVLGNSCTSSYGYLAGTDNIRAHDINIMFSDKKIKGIFAIRGGYGSARLLDKLDFELIRKNPKIFAGYSDITALHIAINQMSNLITYHSPMPATELYKDTDNFTITHFINNIFNDAPLTKLDNPSGYEIETLVKGKCIGPLTGGNLSLICSSLGTKYEINTKNKVLFFEDVEEAPYRIDRMLTQLVQAGKFKDIKGIILGGFTDCVASDPNKSLSLIQIFNDILLPLGKPTIYNVSCGHLLPTLTLPLGATVHLDATKKKITLI